MEAYTSFAAVYDTFMDNVPYEEWGAYLHAMLVENHIEDGIVLDLGCGTGTMTEYLADQGYDMIGVDYSEEMLDVALEKKERSGHDILYLCQDMREFELYGTVRAIVSVCDSINYILEPEELKQVLHWVYNYLDMDGVFIFDFNTEYKYREVLGDCTIAESRDACSFIWENYYYEEEKINEYELTLFVKDEALSGDGQDIYQRYQETHLQRGYTLGEIKGLLSAAGLRFIAAYDGFTKEEPKEDSERICIIVKK